MNTKERLLELKKKMKKKRPSFLIKESKFSNRIESKWRLPRGRHSKTRQMHRGRQALPNPGYRSPKDVRGLSVSGLEIIQVQNIQELLSLNPTTQGAVVSAEIGNKKRLEILKLAQEKEIVILNVNDVDSKIKRIEADFLLRKEHKAKKLSEKSRKEEEKKKKAEEKKKKESAEKSKSESKSEKSKEGIESEIESELGEVSDTEKSLEKQEAQKKEVEKLIIKKQ